MRLFVFTVLAGLFFSFMAATRPAEGDEYVIAVFDSGMSRDTIFLGTSDSQVTLLRFLSDQRGPIGVTALVKQSDLTEEAKSALGITFVMNAFSLRGCATSSDSIPEREGLTI